MVQPERTARFKIKEVSKILKAVFLYKIPTIHQDWPHCACNGQEVSGLCLDHQKCSACTPPLGCCGPPPLDQSKSEIHPLTKVSTDFISQGTETYNVATERCIG